MILIDEKNVDVSAFRWGEKKLADLRTELSERQRELSAATERYLQQQRANKSKLDCEAENLLGNNAEQVQSDSIRELAHDVSIYERAVQMQSDVVNKLRNGFSTAVCNAQRKHYVETERRIAAAVQELALANEAEIEFFNELRALGVTPQFRPMRVNIIGTLSDSQSLATFHAREVAEHLPEVAA